MIYSLVRTKLKLLSSIGLVLTLALGGTAKSIASEHNWKTFSTLAHSGYVLKGSHPESWKTGFVYPPTFSFLFNDIPTIYPDVTASGGMYFHWSNQNDATYLYGVKRENIPLGTMSILNSGTATSEDLNGLIPVRDCGPEKAKCTEFSRLPIEVSGFQGLLIEQSGSRAFDPDKNMMVVPEGAHRFSAYFAAKPDQMALTINFNTSLRSKSGNWYGSELPEGQETQGYENTILTKVYQELRPELIKLLSTLEFRTLADLDSADIYKKMFERSFDTYFRQRFTANLSLELIYPSNWEWLEFESIPPVSDRDFGQYMSVITQPEITASVGELESLFVVTKGVIPYTKTYFTATAEELVPLFLTEYELVSSEIEDYYGLNKLVFWQSNALRVSTETTYVKTFVGKDANGADLKIRIYTAGGGFAVLNFIYVADVADFDRTLPAIEEIIRSAQAIHSLIQR